MLPSCYSPFAISPTRRSRWLSRRSSLWYVLRSEPRFARSAADPSLCALSSTCRPRTPSSRDTMDSGKTSVGSCSLYGTRRTSTTDTDLRSFPHPTVQAIYESDYATEFEKLGIWYEHRLIDDVSPLLSLPSLGASLISSLHLNRWLPR